MSLKKKFMDILFEPTEPDEVNDAVVEDNESVFVKEEPVIEKPVNTITAKDVLYKKQGQSAFIDYVSIPVEETKEKKVEVKEDEIYEFSSNLSPIFGVIGSKESEKAPVKKPVSTAQTNRPESQHLDIVTSPIYGYSTAQNNMDGYPSVNIDPEETDEEEIHRLFETQDNQRIEDEDINLFNAYEEE